MNTKCKCGNEKDYRSKMCLDCYSKSQRKTERPPYEQLLNEIKELGYVGVGKKYNVSDNSIRKWKKYYETDTKVVKNKNNILKTCKNCNNEFEISKTKLNEGKGKFCSVNCYNQYRDEQKQCNKVLTKKHQIKHKYGITMDEYNLMLMEQNNNCKICGDTLIKPCIDHCHLTKEVRGVLCNNCNTGLGMFKDNITILENAIKYLEKYNK